MDLFVEDGTTISGFAFLCTRAELAAAIKELEQAAFSAGYGDTAPTARKERLRTARAHVRALLGMDDGESELRPDSTG